MGGPNPLAMAPIVTTRRSGFESLVWARNGNPWYRVQALGSNGQVLATTRTVQLPPHLAIYSRSVFVPPSNGIGAIPVGCFAPTSCKLVTKLRSGNTELASTGKEILGAGQSGLLFFFRLSPAPRRSLAHAHGRRLGVTVTVQDVGGPGVTSSVTLVPYSASGSVAQRIVTRSKAFGTVGSSGFVSPSGFGGILAECFMDASCPVRATVTVGRTTIAQTRTEFIGAHELGYVNIQLTSQGKSMLAHARGHQLGVRATLTRAGSTQQRRYCPDSVPLADCQRSHRRRQRVDRLLRCRSDYVDDDV